MEEHLWAYRNELNNLSEKDFDERVNQKYVKNLADEKIVLAYGESDDLCILTGAINDEISCYDGNEVVIDPKSKKLIFNECDECDKCNYFLSSIANYPHICIKKYVDNAFFDIDIDDVIPHEHFVVYSEPENIYFRGLLFFIDDLDRCLQSPPELNWIKYNATQMPKHGSLVLLKNKKYRYPVTAKVDIYHPWNFKELTICQWTVLDGYGAMHGAFPADTEDEWLQLSKE